MPHAPSCSISRAYRGEKAEYTVVPNDKTDMTIEKILKASGFAKSSFTWIATLDKNEAEALRSRLMGNCASFSPSCSCYDPTMSAKQNRDWNIVRSWNEEAAGWPAGAPRG